MKKFMSISLAVMLSVLLAACSQQDGETDRSAPTQDNKGSQPVFKIGAIPDQNVSALKRRFGEFADYLEKQTDLKVEYVNSRNYAALVSAFKRGEVQLAWFGGLTGVQARNAVPGAEAIAQRPTDAEFHSVFIVHEGLDVHKLKDLKGLSFTFGSESSTSGHLMPRYFLTEAGIDPETDFDGKPNYSGSHDKTWKLVESGAYQAGALNELVWKSRKKQGKINLDKVHAFYTTPAFYDYNWTINGNVNEKFGEGTKKAVQKALLSMNKEQNQILELFHTDKFIKTNNENYAKIKKVAKNIGIIK
ncbi:MAG TPA: putative selenate ABC transporter substrate-binding protein [Bacillales bacterium]